MFEYGNPEAILAELLPTLKPNELGHTALDDFDHMCSVTRCPRDNQWAKLAFVWEWSEKSRREDELLAHIKDLGDRATRVAELIGKAVGKMEPRNRD